MRKIISFVATFLVCFSCVDRLERLEYNHSLKTLIEKIEKPFIGLIANADALINNIFYHTSLDMEHRGADELLSVTVVKEHQLSEEALVAQVKEELKRECGIKNLTFVKRYQIPKALPQLDNLQYEVSPSETQLKERIFLAGDVQLNGSLNAAMLSGEKAALGLMQVLSKTGVIQ